MSTLFNGSLRVEYMTGWGHIKGLPGQPIKESSARSCYETGMGVRTKRFTAAVYDDEISATMPRCYLEIQPMADFITVYFLNQPGSIDMIFSFNKKEGRLFLTEITDYEYPDEERRHGRDKCLKVISAHHGVDGIVKLTTNIRTSRTVTVEDYRDVDVSTHWDEIPEFGRWESLIRKNDRWEQGTAAAQSLG